jgi:hypothetical protein
MGFEIIENCKPASALSTIPPEGVRVSSRTLGRRKGGVTRYIKIMCGAVLAKRLCLTGDKVRVAIAFGTDKDAGKIRLSVDVTAGQFIASRDKQGRYAISINEASASGLFALQFPPFDVASIPVEHQTGTPPAAIFKASDAMLTIED